MGKAPETENLAVFLRFRERCDWGAGRAPLPIRHPQGARAAAAQGSIVVKKAYCDWERYKDFKAAMHEAAFELIEIPHIRQSGKNSADIRMVVDALDLCYTKSHVDTFVIVSATRTSHRWSASCGRTTKS